MLSDWWFTELYSNVTPIEIIWIGVAIIGFLVSLLNFHRSMVTLTYLDLLKQNGLLRLVGTTLVVEEGIRVLVQVTFLTIGLIAALYSPGETGGRIISWLIVLAAILILCKSLYAARARSKVVKYENAKGG